MTTFDEFMWQKGEQERQRLLNAPPDPVKRIVSYDERKSLAEQNRTAEVAADRLHEERAAHPAIPLLTVARAVMASTQRIDDPWSVVATVEAMFLLNPGEIGSGPHHRRVIDARRVACYVLRERMKLSYPQIATVLGAGSHSTPLQAVKDMERELREATAVYAVRKLEGVETAASGEAA